MDIRYYVDAETDRPHIHRYHVQTPIATEETMNQNRFPEGWDEDRVRRALEHYEGQTPDEALARIIRTCPFFYDSLVS